MVLCYNDYRFSNPTIIIKWMIWIHLFCFFGRNQVKSIQTERVFHEDRYTLKYIKYYIVLKETIQYKESGFLLHEDRMNDYFTI